MQERLSFFVYAFSDGKVPGGYLVEHIFSSAAAWKNWAVQNSLLYRDDMFNGIKVYSAQQCAGLFYTIDIDIQCGRAN